MDLLLRRERQSDGTEARTSSSARGQPWCRKPCEAGGQRCVSLTARRNPVLLRHLPTSRCDPFSQCSDLDCKTYQLGPHCAQGALMAEGNERPDICGPCGGACCRNYPGPYHPNDLGSTREEVEAQVADLLSQGLAQVDWWEGVPPWPFLRPTTLDRRAGSNRSPTYGGACVLLTPSGCRLSFAERPLGCRSLEPAAGMICGETKYSKPEAWRAWQPHADMLWRLADTTKRQWPPKF